MSIIPGTGDGGRIVKKDVETSIEDLKTALKSEKVDDIKEKTTNLSSVLMKLGEVAYKDNSQQPETENKSSHEDKSDEKEEVVDADFEEVKPDDDKKNAS